MTEDLVTTTGHRTTIVELLQCNDPCWPLRHFDCTFDCDMMIMLSCPFLLTILL